MEEWTKNMFCMESVNTTCFLCLNHPSSHTILNTEVGLGIKTEDGLLPNVPDLLERFSLTPIFRYLQLKPMQAVSVDGKNTEKFSVELCKQCLPVCSKLSDLCSELELLQMKINYHIKSFSGILEHSKDDLFDTSRCGYAVDDGSILKNLRANLKTKCKEQLESILPKVVLFRETNSVKPIPPNLGESFTDHFAQPDEAPSDSSKSGHPDPPKRKAKSSKNTTSPNKKKLNKSHICIHCKPIRQFNQRYAKSHQIINHIEALFPSSKLQNISQDQFKLFCNHAIKTEIKSCQERTSELGQSWKQCSHCQENHRDNIALSVHLVTQHLETIFGKILQLQESHIEEQINGKSETNSSVTLTCALRKPLNRNKCNLCTPPRFLEGNAAFERHKVNQHLESIFTASQMSHLPMDDFKLYCGHVLKLEIISCSEIVSEDATSRKCPHCPSIYRDQYALRNHLCSVHQEILAVTILILQKSTTLLEIRGLRLQARKWESFKCDTCEMKFAHNSSLVTHKKEFFKFGTKILSPFGQEVIKPEIDPNLEEGADGNWDEQQQIQLPDGCGRDYEDYPIVVPLEIVKSELEDQKGGMIMIVPD